MNVGRTQQRIGLGNLIQYPFFVEQPCVGCRQRAVLMEADSLGSDQHFCKDDKRANDEGKNNHNIGGNDRCIGGEGALVIDQTVCDYASQRKRLGKQEDAERNVAPLL